MRMGPCRVSLAVAVLLLAGCEANWVSPYNADLQKRAVDMLADVVAWDGHMRGVAGTAAADPRHPDVQAKLNEWHGTIVAMAEIQRGIDPRSTRCDRILDALNTATHPIFIQLNSGLNAVAVGAAGAIRPPSHCETLPQIFTRLDEQVTDTIPTVLREQCRLPWLSDDYFVALRQARATSGAPARSTLPNSSPGMPTAAQQQTAARSCAGLFGGNSNTIPRTREGDAVSAMTVHLRAIIYREGRQAPPSK